MTEITYRQDNSGSGGNAVTRKLFCRGALQAIRKQVIELQSLYPPLVHLLLLPRGETIVVPRLGCHPVGAARPPKSIVEFGESKIALELPPKSTWPTRLEPWRAIVAEQEYSPFKELSQEPYRVHLLFGDGQGYDSLRMVAEEMVELSDDLAIVVHGSNSSIGSLIFSAGDCIHGHESEIMDRWFCTCHWWAWKVIDSSIHTNPQIVFSGEAIEATFTDRAVETKLSFSFIDKNVFEIFVEVVDLFLVFLDRAPDLPWASTYSLTGGIEAQSTRPALETTTHAPSDFVDIRPVSSGLYGRVYKAFQASLSRQVAIKVIKNDWPNAATALAHARALTKVGVHPNLATVYEVRSLSLPDYDSPQDVIVMEWVDGQTMGARLQNSQIELAAAKKLVLTLFATVQYMHDRNIAHGDLHLGNLLITDGETLKIIDLDSNQPIWLSQLPAADANLMKMQDLDLCKRNAITLLRSAGASHIILSSLDAKFFATDDLAQLSSFVLNLLDTSTNAIEVKSPRVEVVIHHAVISRGAIQKVIIVEARNHGAHMVKLRSFGIEVPEIESLIVGYGARAFQSDVSFPCRLEPNDSCSVWIEQNFLAQAIREKNAIGTATLVGFYRDAVGNEYNSAPMKFRLGS